MKEMTIHTWFKNQMKKRFKENFTYIKAPSGIYSSRRGISDFVCCVHGIFVAVEVKAPGNTLSLIQEDYLQEVETAGGVGLELVGKDVTIFDKIHNEVKARLSSTY